MNWYFGAWYDKTNVAGNTATPSIEGHLWRREREIPIGGGGVGRCTFLKDRVLIVAGRQLNQQSREMSCYSECWGKKHLEKVSLLDQIFTAMKSQWQDEVWKHYIKTPASIRDCYKVRLKLRARISLTKRRRICRVTAIHICLRIAQPQKQKKAFRSTIDALSKLCIWHFSFRGAQVDNKSYVWCN